MGKPLIISKWLGKASFTINEEPRLFNYLCSFYDGKVNRTSSDGDAIKFQICEHLTDTRKNKDIVESELDLHLIIFHPEGDAKYFHYKELKKYGNIVSCNYAWKDVNYFHYWAYDYRNAIISRNIKTNTPDKLSTKFLCFNGRPDWHRYYTMQRLYDNDLIKQGFISFLDRYNNYNNISHQNTFYKIASMMKLSDTSYVDKMIKEKTNLVLDKTTEQVSKDDRSHDENLFADTSISLITETYSEAYRGLFITEKSWRPIANMHLPIWIAQPFMVQAFREFGFDMFDDIIDNSYDKIIIDPMRFDAAIKALKKLLTKMKKLDVDNVLERLESNRNKFLSMKIKEKEILSWIK